MATTRRAAPATPRSSETSCGTENERPANTAAPRQSRTNGGKERLHFEEQSVTPSSNNDARPIWFTPPQKAAEIGVEPQKILDLIAAGELRAINIAANPRGRRPRWRINQADWEAWLASRANAKPAPAAPKQRQQRPKVLQPYY